LTRRVFFNAKVQRTQGRKGDDTAGFEVTLETRFLNLIPNLKIEVVAEGSI